MKQNRWNIAYPNQHLLSAKNRMLRGELMRQVKAVAPEFQNAHKLSINDLHDVLQSANILQIHRLTRK